MCCLSAWLLSPPSLDWFLKNVFCLITEENNFWPISPAGYFVQQSQGNVQMTKIKDFKKRGLDFPKSQGKEFHLCFRVFIPAQRQIRMFLWWTLRYLGLCWGPLSFLVSYSQQIAMGSLVWSDFWVVLIWCQSSKMPGVVAHACDLSTWKVNQEFKVSSGYIASSVPAWVMWDPDSKQIKTETKTVPPPRENEWINNKRIQ